MYPQMKRDASLPPMNRAEQETETEANRLIEQIRGAMVAVTLRSSDDTDALDVAADRIERASRDLADALRELACARRAYLEAI